MSAIAGLRTSEHRPGTAEPDPSRAATALLAAMSVRATGARVVVTRPGAALAVSDGSGPATDPSGRWTVVLDGEPTNQRPLTEELQARGVLAEGPASTADILVAVLSEIGFERGITRLEGEVAIAAWDAQEQVLWLARDRAGARSLAWSAPSPGELRFASDASALAPPLDPVGLAAAVTLGLVPAPRTAFAGVHALAPGHLLRVDAHGADVKAWWTPSPNPAGAGGSAPRWARSIEFATELAVRQRVPSDGAFAVAVDGIYSAAVATIAADVARRSPVVLRVRWDGDDASPLPSPLPVDSLPLTPDRLPELLEALAGAPTPLVDPLALVWLLLAEGAWERDCAVLLTGTGGAALHEVPRRPSTPFGRARRLARVLATEAPSGPFGRLAERVSPPHQPLGTDLLALLPPPTDDASALLPDLDALASAAPPMDRASLPPWGQRRLVLPEGALALEQHAAATAGVRIRSPLADARLAALLAEVPVEHLRGDERGLFPVALASRLPGPPHPPSRRGPPVGAWLRGPAAGLVEGLPGRLERHLAPEHVAWHIERMRQGDDLSGRRVWACVVLASWLGRRQGGDASGLFS